MKKKSHVILTCSKREPQLFFRLLIFLSIAIGLCLGAYSQNQPLLVNGVVKNEEGQPVRGASINVKGTLVTSASDEDGAFSIQVSSTNSILVISFVGMATQEITVGEQRNLSVTLVSESRNLGEVVVIGYGTQKKVNLTGAVSTIAANDLAIRPVGQVSSALQGLAAGVTIKQPSGRPGADGGEIRIRGIGTLNDANPLVIIDGIEGNMNELDPSLIESVSVLKDASSSSIYGSRAANGVILITTKRAGSEGLRLNLSSYMGFQQPTNLPKIVNALDHMNLMNLAYTNVGSTAPFPQDLIDKYVTEGAANRDLYPDTDWQRSVLNQSGMIQNQFLSISGGGQKVRFMTSLGYFDQNGLYETSQFKRYLIRNNLDLKFSEKLNVRVDVQGIFSKTTDAGVGASGIMFAIRRTPASQQGVFSNGLWGEGWNGNNPIARSRFESGHRITRNPTAVANISVIYKPLKYLTAEFNAAPRYITSVGEIYDKATTTYKADGSQAFVVPERSRLTRSSSQTFMNNFRATLTFQKEVQDHSFKLLAGASREDSYTDVFSAFREQFLLPDYAVLDAGSSSFMGNSGTANEWALQSFFGRFNYDYKQKYLLEVNGRYDGSSRFATNYKYGFFPSVSAGWRITQEPFMDNLRSSINEAKLRVSWGKLGNQNIGNYPFTSSISLGAYPMGGSILNTAELTTLANSTISWESSVMTNVGFDAVFLSNFTISFDYFQKKTYDILYDLDIPLTIGLEKPYQNAGIVDNKGWELVLGYRKTFGDFRLNINANVSDVKNTVVDLKGVNRTGLTVSREGSSINSFYGFRSLGYFQTDQEAASAPTQFGAVRAGDLKYEDINHDGLINDNDAVIIGSTIPRFTYGVNLNTSYKNLDLTVFFQGVGKADGYINNEGLMPFYLGGTVHEMHKDYWTPDNPHAAFPRLAFNASNNIVNSSFWVRDASYLRLKNIQIGYNLSKNIVNRIGIRGLRIYANAQNLFTIDKFWEGYDVETPVSNGNSYPQLKVFNFGIDVNF